MELCGDGHDEVCYEGSQCPACSVKDDMQIHIDELGGQVLDLERDKSELQERIDELDWHEKEE